MALHEKVKSVSHSPYKHREAKVGQHHTYVCQHDMWSGWPNRFPATFTSQL